jgi:proteic killer suppression protein
MIQSFQHKGLERFFRSGSKSGIQPQHAEKLRLMLTALDHAVAPKDMNAPGWRLHRLGGDLAGFWSVSVSGNWRLIFRFKGVDAVDINYVDYH